MNEKALKLHRSTALCYYCSRRRVLQGTLKTGRKGLGVVYLLLPVNQLKNV
jgi:hypothetical protein